MASLCKLSPPGQQETPPETPGSCLDLVLRVIVVLKGEPSPQPQVVCTLEQVFFKDLFACSSDQSLCHSYEKRTQCMMLPPPRLEGDEDKEEDDQSLLQSCPKSYKCSLTGSYHSVALIRINSKIQNLGRILRHCSQTLCEKIYNVIQDVI